MDKCDIWDLVVFTFIYIMWFEKIKIVLRDDRIALVNKSKSKKKGQTTFGVSSSIVHKKNLIWIIRNYLCTKFGVYTLMDSNL